MRVVIDFDIPESAIVSTAASIWDSPTIGHYCQQAAIAAAEVILVNRIAQLRPLAADLSDAKGSLESLQRQIELMYALGLPETSLDPTPTDTEEVIALLRDALSDLESFLRRQQQR